MFTLCLNNQDKKWQQRFIPDYLTYFGVQLVIIISYERPIGFLHAWQDHTYNILLGQPECDGSKYEYSSITLLRNPRLYSFNYSLSVLFDSI